MFSLFVSSIVYCLELALLLLVLRRKSRRHLMAFTAFIVLLVVRESVSLIVVHTNFYYSRSWFDIFWTSEFVLTAMYLFMIAEIATRSLRGYPSIWRPASTLLSVVALALTAWTATATMHYFGHRNRFVMVGDQHLVLTVTILLLILMGICAYYRLKLPPLYQLILVGIGIYASVQVLANEIEIKYKLGPDALEDFARRLSFGVSVAMWIYAVWRFAGPPTRHAELIPQSKYDALSPQVHNRLRDVIQKLATLAGQRS